MKNSPFMKTHGRIRAEFSRVPRAFFYPVIEIYLTRPRNYRLRYRWLKTNMIHRVNGCDYRGFQSKGAGVGWAAIIAVGSIPRLAEGRSVILGRERYLQGAGLRTDWVGNIVRETN